MTGSKAFFRALLLDSDEMWQLGSLFMSSVMSGDDCGEKWWFYNS